MKVLILLGILAVAFAKPCDDKDHDKLKEVLHMTEADLEEVLKHVSKADIREFTGKVNGDLKEVQKFLNELASIQEPLDKDGEIDPRFIAASALFERAERLLEDDMRQLPPIPDDLSQLHFFGDCVQRARDTNFDDYADHISFINAVIRQVVTCAVSGIDIMVETTDINGLTDDDITAKELAGRLEKMRGLVIEMNHLGNFIMDFIGRLEQGLYGQVSNNEMVHGPADDANGTPGSKKRELERRLYQSLLKRLGPKGRKGPRPSGAPLPTGGAGKRPRGTRPSGPRPTGGAGKRPRGTRPSGPRPTGGAGERPRGTRPSGPRPTGGPRGDIDDLLDELEHELDKRRRLRN